MAKSKGDLNLDEEDITPSPRILRTLGEIPFQPSQCLAELIDNSLDAFAAQSADGKIDGQEIQIVWSGEGVPPKDRTVDVSDNGPGMSLESLRNCVRAGYTSKNAEGSLGLFGMGFNIATARLGERTRILSATPESTEWVGLEIDFKRLESAGKFRAPIVRKNKTHPKESGTRICIGGLKPNIFSEITQHEADIREFLSQIYSPLLIEKSVSILLRGKRLLPVRHCVWDEKRFVLSAGGKVPARVSFEFPQGTALFDSTRNRYLSREEEDEYRAEDKKPAAVVERKKMVRGWVGIQRFADPDEYGIDFIRNGRKILVQDKSLFYYLNPFTNKNEHEYPKELGTSIGGRIVGEVYVDHLPPTYQKNDFDRSDVSWAEMVESLRGAGPILSRRRKELNMTAPNTSPLSVLMNAFRRVDAGTRYLFAPNGKSKEMYRQFQKGNPEFDQDVKWWQAALEEDRRKGEAGGSDAEFVDKGESSSEDASKYGPGVAAVGDTGELASMEVQRVQVAQNDPIAELRGRSREVVGMTGKYGGAAIDTPVFVRVWEVEQGRIYLNGVDSPARFQAAGNESEFFYNPRHDILEKYSLDPRIFLLIAVGEHIKVREREGDILSNFSAMLRDIDDLRIDVGHVQEVAAEVFARLREAAPDLLRPVEPRVIASIHERSGDVEEIAGQLHGDPVLMNKFLKSQPGAIEVLGRSPSKVLVRLVELFPEQFMDGRFFQTLYSGISLPDQKTVDKLKSDAKGRVVSFLNDALWIQGDALAGMNKVRRRKELERCSHSLEILRLDIR